MANPDRYGREWDLPASELCPTCGQPDNCGDCNHEPYTDDEAACLRGDITIDEMMEARP
jgi:hypothetical protein